MHDAVRCTVHGMQRGTVNRAQRFPDVDAATDDLRLNVVDQRNGDGRGWLVNHQMTEAAYDANMAWAEDNDFRLVDFET